MAKKNIIDIREELLKNSLPMRYLRQPIELTFLKQNLSLSQINFIMEIIEKLQDKIKEALDAGKDENNRYPYLFSKEEMYGDLIPLELYFSSLNISASHYKEVDAAIRSLQNMNMVYNDVDENGRNVIKYQVLFPSIEIPTSIFENDGKVNTSGVKDKRRQGVIKIKMMRDTANALFSLKQHTQYLKAFVQSSNSQYTSRLYMCLSTYKDDKSHGNKWNVSYNELRRIMGVTEFFIRDKGGVYRDSKGKAVTFKEEDVEELIKEGVWVRTKAPNYGNFKQNVLTKAKNDFDEIAKNNGTDINFDYQEILPDGKKRGTPERIIFTIYKTDVGEMIKERNAEVSFRNEWKRRFIAEYDMSNSQAETLAMMITTENEHVVHKAIAEARQQISQRRASIKNIRLYYYKAIKNELENHDVPLAEEVTEDTTHSVPEVSRKDAELFGKLLSEVDATWREALSLYEVTSDKVYVRMPAPATYETFMAQGGETFFENVKTAFKKELGIMFKNK